MIDNTGKSDNKYIPAAFHGAVDVLSSMANAVPLIHGTAGCATYTWTNIMRASLVTRAFPSTALTDRQLSSANGHRSISEAIKFIRTYHSPSLIGVISTHFTDIVGENLKGLLKSINDVVYIPTSSLQFDENEGKAMAMVNIVQEKAKEVEMVPGTVNIIGPTINTFNATSDLQELIHMLEILGIEINTIFPYQCKVEDIENITRGQLNLVMYPEFGRPVAEYLKKQYDRDYLEVFPIGYERTIEFLNELITRLNLDKGSLKEVINHYKYNFDCFDNLIKSPWFDHLANELSKFVIVASPTLAYSIADFLVNSLGMDPLLIAITGRVNKDEVENELNKRGITPRTLLINPQSSVVSQKIREYLPSIIFGTDNEEIIARELGVTGFIPASHPSIVTWGLGITPFLGFRGANFICHEILRAATKVLKHIRSIGVSGAAIKPETFNNQDFIWSEEANERFQQAMSLVPAFLGNNKIAIAEKFRKNCEELAQKNGDREICLKHVTDVYYEFSKMFAK